MVDWQIVSAVVQAASAVAIVGLTLALVLTTRRYTTETRRMADAMLRARSEDAAERLSAALVTFRRELVTIPHSHPLGPGARPPQPDVDNKRRAGAREVMTEIAGALQRDGQVLRDEELRDRVSVFNALAWLGCLHIASGDEGDSRMRQRLSRATATLKADVDAYRRGEPISERTLPASRDTDELEAFLSRRTT